MNENITGGRLVTVDIRLAGQVKRYHTWPTLHTQTVAEHTWQVLRIFSMIFGPPREPPTLSFIMYHDCGEVATGDLPFPVKSKNPSIKAIIKNLEDETLVKMERFWGGRLFVKSGLDRHMKVADLIEMAEFGFHEASLGNVYGWPVAVRTLDAVYQMLGEFAAEQQDAIRNYVNHRLELTRDIVKVPPDALDHIMKQWEKPSE